LAGGEEAEEEGEGRRALKRGHIDEEEEGTPTGSTDTGDVSGEDGGGGNGNGKEHPHHEEKGQGLGEREEERGRGGKRARVEGATEEQPPLPQPAPVAPPIPPSSSSSSFSAATGVLSSGTAHDQQLQLQLQQQHEPPPPAATKAAAAAAAAAVEPPPTNDLDVEALIQATMGDMEAAGAEAGAARAGQQPVVGTGGAYDREGLLGASASPLFYISPTAEDERGGDGGASPMQEPPPQEEGGAHPYSFPDETPLVDAVGGGVGGGGERYDPSLLPVGGSGASGGGAWPGASPLVHMDSWGSATEAVAADGGGGGGGGGGDGGLLGRRSSSADDMLRAGVLRKASLSSSHSVHGPGGGSVPRSTKSIMQRIEKHKVLQGWEDDYWLWDDVFAQQPQQPPQGAHLSLDSASPEKAGGGGWGVAAPLLDPPAVSAATGSAEGATGALGAEGGAAAPSSGGAPEPPLSPERRPRPLTPLPPPSEQAGEPQPQAQAQAPPPPLSSPSPPRRTSTASPTIWDRIGPDFQAALPELRRNTGPLLPAQEKGGAAAPDATAPDATAAAMDEVAEEGGPTLVWSPAWGQEAEDEAGAGTSYDEVAAATGGGRAATRAWTAEEAAQFEEGIKAYRRNFGKISRQCVPTRSVREVIARFYSEWKRSPGYRAWKADTLVGRRVLMERTKPPWKCLGGQDPIERVKGTIEACARYEDGDEILDVRWEDGRVGQLYRYEAEALLLHPNEAGPAPPLAAAAAAAAAAAVATGTAASTSTD
jgi:hypothetical protein